MSCEGADFVRLKTQDKSSFSAIRSQSAALNEAPFSLQENDLKSYIDFSLRPVGGFVPVVFVIENKSRYINAMTLFSKLLIALLVLTTVPFSQTATGQEITGITRPTSAWSSALINSAREQVGVTLLYDGSYQSLPFPGGDIPRLRGVCTDVVVRALRDAHGLDLQAKVNADMKANFAAYPKIWGLSRPDSNIDHRRVPNLQTYFKRRGAAVPITDIAADYLPGDVVSWMLPGNTPHIGIVTDLMNGDATHPMIVHNIGWGTRINDMLFDYKITGHYRIDGALK